MEAAVEAAMEPPAHTVDQAVDRVLGARAAAAKVCTRPCQGTH